MPGTQLARLEAGNPQQRAASQAAAVEQTRAVAEVQAAVIAAKSMPRDVDEARAAMLDACGRMSMAARAFYSVPRAGGAVSGPSVHLARELARVWGNVQHGILELSRDDERGQSEVQAFAWDVQTNTRNVRTIVVPHARQTRSGRVPLTDLGDIVNSNSNAGSKAVRECIFQVLPRWFVDEAEDACRRTLEHGAGVPLEERRQNALGKLGELGVDRARAEAKVGRAFGAWTAQDVANLGVAYRSIVDGDAQRDELFPVPEQPAAADLKAAGRSRTRPAARRDDVEPPADPQPAAPAPGGPTPDNPVVDVDPRDEQPRSPLQDAAAASWAGLDDATPDPDPS